MFWLAFTAIALPSIYSIIGLLFNEDIVDLTSFIALTIGLISTLFWVAGVSVLVPAVL